MKFNICLLDLDRVMADFDSIAIKAMGLTREEYEEKVPPGVYDLYEGVMSAEEFWKCIEEYPNFWESLPKFPDSDEILNLCEHFFDSRVAFLTSPPKSNDQSYLGKLKWVKKHYPRMTRKFFLGANKYLIAHPGAVLIDDSEKVCSDFQRAGGNVILVPTRNNSLHSLINNRVDVIRNKLLDLCDE